MVDPNSVEEEAAPLAVLRRVLVEIDGHQSAKILNYDDLSVERNSEGLCMGDDERALFINLDHGEQVVALDGMWRQGN
jgi:hypothetical protein